MRVLLCTLMAAVSIGRAWGFDFIAYPPIRWPAGEVPMDLQLDETMPLHAPLSDGTTSWNSVARQAFEQWNAVVNPIQFTFFTDNERANGNERNEVFFNTSIYGHRFGHGVLAITTTWVRGTKRVEGDTVFNGSMRWDSYRGALDYDTIDLRRVAIHEFGHTVGLDHPDQVGQIAVAIMNSRVSDLDHLAEDDIRGAQTLYADPATRYSPTFFVTPPEAGTIVVTPASPDGTYAPGTIVTITAKPSRGFRFNYWDASQPASARRIRFRVYSDNPITAAFSSNAAPRIVAAPRSQFASAGDNVTMRARVGSASRLTYQWKRDGIDLPGATQATLVLQGVTHDDSGDYSVAARNGKGETESKPARLIVDGY